MTAVPWKRPPCYGNRVWPERVELGPSKLRPDATKPTRRRICCEAYGCTLWVKHIPALDAKICLLFQSRMATNGKNATFACESRGAIIAPAVRSAPTKELIHQRATAQAVAPIFSSLAIRQWPSPDSLSYPGRPSPFRSAVQGSFPKERPLSRDMGRTRVLHMISPTVRHRRGGALGR